MTELGTAAAGLLALIVLFVPLERAFMARHQKVFRPHWRTDLAFFLGQRLVFAAASVAMLEFLFSPLFGIAALSEAQAAFSSIPWLVQVILVFALGDFCAYFGHRLQHRSELLWRFHAIHHSSEHLDFLAAHREHPLDGVYTQFWVNLPAVLVGFDLGTVLGILVFRGAWAVFIHSNTRLPLGPLRFLFGSPALHHHHHAADRRAGNYGNLAPWMDLVFGTYMLPEEEPERFGTPETLPTGYFGLLLYPFRRRVAGPPQLVRQAIQREAEY